MNNKALQELPWWGAGCGVLYGTIGSNQLVAIDPTEVAVANLMGSERARYVQNMFARIAGRYDLMNRIMTAGQDVRWRREVVHRAALPMNGRLLDLGAGTGDLARDPASAPRTWAFLQSWGGGAQPPDQELAIPPVAEPPAAAPPHSWYP